MVLFRPAVVTALPTGSGKRVQPPGREECDLEKITANLRELADGLGCTFSVDSLRVPSFSRTSQVKEFCSGLLDPSSRQYHPWWPVIRRLGSRARLSIAGSIFLFRKTLPGSDPDLGKYVQLLSEPAPAPPAGFFEFARRELESLFKTGWDRSWQNAVSTSTLSTSACRESRRSQGGPRGLALRSEFSRSDFLELCSGDVDLGRPDPVEVTKVECDGKKRLITVSPALFGVLSPLHRLLYDHISRSPWLLRGEASPASFTGFGRVRGEVFVSGDYESATDNLNLEVAEAILTFILRRCTHVPLEVREFALASLRTDFLSKGKLSTHRRGQLMGSLLCFPLLCLQNYLAFRFFVRRKVPVRINGDDIVFRARPEEYAVWSAGVGRIGLKLSLGKTSVSSSWFSLNSTFFSSRLDGTVHLIPIIRSTQWFRAVEDPSAIAGRVAAFARGFPDRELWLKRLLVRVRPAIDASQRSVKRGLGVPVSVSVLKAAGLWYRECYYLSLPSEPPLPPPRSAFAQRCVPPGWTRFPVARVSPDDRLVESVVLEAMAALTWSVAPLPPSEVSSTLWDACREGTVRFSDYVSFLKRSSRLLRISRRAAVRSGCAPTEQVLVFLRQGRRFLVWRPPGFCTRRPGLGF
jgi:hypothetical protein